MACLFFVGAALVAPRFAHAYPSSVIFVPTGETRDLGNVEAFAYTAVTFAPKTESDASWFGTQVGLLPRIRVAKGVAMGGLEIGVDALNADLYGTSEQFMKPLANAKLGLVSETRFTPALAVGAMVAPFHASRSQNFVYGVATKKFTFGDLDFGTVTAGVGGYLTRDPELYAATFPFQAGARVGLLAGYVSPSLGPLSLSVDHLGGTGEVNSTNAAINFKPTESLSLSLGAFAANDRSEPHDGAFAQLSAEFDVIDAFRKKKAPGVEGAPSEEQAREPSSIRRTARLQESK